MLQITLAKSARDCIIMFSVTLMLSIMVTPLNPIDCDGDEDTPRIEFPAQG